MKKILLFTALAIFLLSSCKKSSVAPPNTFTATVDGTNQSFNTNLTARLGSSIKTNSVLLLVGANGSATDSYILSIQLNVNESIAAGSTYTNAPNSTDGYVAVAYTKSSSSLTNPDSYLSDPNGNYLTTVKITALSNTNVQGTFSAQLLYTDGKTVKTVTNGKFNVNLNN